MGNYMLSDAKTNSPLDTILFKRTTTLETVLPFEQARKQIDSFVSMSMVDGQEDEGEHKFYDVYTFVKEKQREFLFEIVKNQEFTFLRFPICTLEGLMVPTENGTQIKITVKNGIWSVVFLVVYMIFLGYLFNYIPAHMQEMGWREWFGTATAIVFGLWLFFQFSDARDQIVKRLVYMLKITNAMRVK
jgi:hypothetical protein